MSNVFVKEIKKMHIAVIGSGGHAEVVVESALAQYPEAAISIFCNFGGEKNKVLGIPIFKYENILTSFMEQGVTNYIVAVGDIAFRIPIIEELVGSSFIPISIIHSAATISNSAKIGMGVFCGPLSVIHSNAIVGDHCIVNTMALVEHGSCVGTNCHLAPRSSVLGNSSLGKNVFIGGNALVFPKKAISDDITVGANSMVNTDLTKRGIYYGTPAKLKI